ncbi:MAG: deoxyribonuclease IV [Terriglobales bacterium]
MRIGAHVSSGGGIANAVERARAVGGDTLQVFTASPRQWRARPVAAGEAIRLRRLQRQARLRPLVVHANYLINPAGEKPVLRERSRAALRGELERALAIGADYLVLHPGSGTVAACVNSIQTAAAGLAWGKLQLLVENMAGGGQRLASSFAEWAAILDALADLPVGGCLDTCHAWAAGYDLVSEGGYAAAMRELNATVGVGRTPVVHANDAKTARGSHHDRHAHIGEGQLGEGFFHRLLHDRRWRGKAFLVETPPAGQGRDIAALRRLAQ